MIIGNEGARHSLEEQKSNLKNYYLENKQSLLRDFDKTVKKFGRKALLMHFDAGSTNTIIKEIRYRFEGLIPKLPYVGGKRSAWTTDLVQSAWALALYRTLQTLGLNADQTGKILFEVINLRLYSYPKVLRKLFGRWTFSQVSMRKMKKQAHESHQRFFPDGWVWTYKRGDGKDFDFGYDVIECGLYKFFQKEKAIELLPYLCQTEFLKSEALGTGLTRMTTLAEGQTVCNFRSRNLK